MGMNVTILYKDSEQMDQVSCEIVQSLIAQACNANAYGANSVIAQQEAMKKLEETESSEGFMGGLLAILSFQGAPSDMRLLSVISLKNLVLRNWTPRGGPRRVLRKEEKSALREYCLGHLAEADSRVFLQLANLIARIARHDWPVEWKDLFKVLFDFLREDNNWLLQRRTMFVLQEVLQELSSKALASAKHALTAACVQLFPHVSAATIQLCQSLMHDNCSALEHIDRASEQSLEQIHAVELQLELLSSAGRSLKHILEKGYSRLHGQALLAQLYADLSFCLSRFIAVYVSITSKLGIVDSANIRDGDDGNILLAVPSNALTLETVQYSCVSLLRRVISDLNSIPSSLQKLYPIEFSPYIGPFLDYYHQHLSLASSCRAGAVGALSAVHFLSNTLSCTDYCLPRGDTVENPSRDRSGDRRRRGSKTAYFSTRLSELPDMDNFRSDESATNEIPYSGSADDLTEEEYIQAQRTMDKMAATAYEVRQQFFRSDKIHSLLTILLQSLVCYSEEDLEEWRSEPEQFYLMQQGQSDTETLKTASEGLYLSLLDFAPTDVASCLLSLLQDGPRQFQLAAAGTTANELVFWDGTYLCAGLSAAVLGRSHVDANQWLRTILMPLFHNFLSNPASGAYPKGGQQILRSRVLWLLSCWMYHFDSELLPDLLRILCLVFDPASCCDVVTILYGIGTLQAVLKTDEFHPTMLLPVLVSLVQSLCQFTGNRLLENETRAEVVQAIAAMVDLMGYDRTQLYPLILPLGEHFTQLWLLCESNSPLKSSIIEGVTQLVRAAGAHAASMQDIALPLIAYSTNGSEESTFLAKDGMDLWITLLRNLPAEHYSERLLQLFQENVPVLFEKDLIGTVVEDVKRVMCLIEANAIIGGERTLLRSSQVLALACRQVIGNVNCRAVPYVTRSMEAYLLISPVAFTSFLYETGALLEMLRVCYASVDDLRPFVADFEEADVAVVSYMSVLARVLLYNPTALQQTVQAIGSEIRQKLISKSVIATDGCILVQCLGNEMEYMNSLWCYFLRLYLDKFDAVGYCSAGVWRRKLWVLALLSLYPTNIERILEWLVEVIEACASVETEHFSYEHRSKVIHLAESVLAMEEDLTLWSASDSEEDNSADDPKAVVEPSESVVNEFCRLLVSDVVGSTSLRQATAERLHRVRESVGVERFNDLLSGVAPDTIELFLS